MSRFLAAIVVVLLTMLLMEAVWFSVVVERLYRPELGELLAQEIRILPAVLFYLFYPVALVILAVRPNDAKNSVSAVFGRGVVLGLAAYGAYELTNLATLVGWSPIVTVVDIIWGAVLSSVAAAAAAVVTQRFFATGNP